MCVWGGVICDIVCMQGGGGGIEETGIVFREIRYPHTFAVLTRIHNLYYSTETRKIMYTPSKPTFCYINIFFKFIVINMKIQVFILFLSPFFIRNIGG